MGQAVGGALLRASHAWADADGLPVQAGIDLRGLPQYQGFGFLVGGKIKSRSAALIHPMWREAR